MLGTGYIDRNFFGTTGTLSHLTDKSFYILEVDSGNI